MTLLNRRWRVALIVIAIVLAATALAFQLDLQRLHGSAAAGASPASTPGHAVAAGPRDAGRAQRRDCAEHQGPGPGDPAALPAARQRGIFKRGTLDLALDARVKNQRLNAPGRLTLTDLELDSPGGVLSTFAGVPRQAVLAALERDGRIELAFTLEGQLDDPKFSLNELFAARFAVGLAEKLGVSLGGLLQGVGSMIKGLFGR